MKRTVKKSVQRGGKNTKKMATESGPDKESYTIRKPPESEKRIIEKTTAKKLINTKEVTMKKTKKKSKSKSLIVKTGKIQQENLPAKFTNSDEVSLVRPGILIDSMKSIQKSMKGLEKNIEDNKKHGGPTSYDVTAMAAGGVALAKLSKVLLDAGKFAIDTNKSKHGG